MERQREREREATIVPEEYLSLLPSTGEILRSRRKKDGEIIEDVVELRSDTKQGFSQHMIELANSQASPAAIDK